MRLPTFTEQAALFSRAGFLTDNECRQASRIATHAPMSQADQDALGFQGGTEIDGAAFMASASAKYHDTVAHIRNIIEGRGLPRDTPADVFLNRVRMLRGFAPKNIASPLGCADAWAYVAEKLEARLLAQSTKRH